MCEGCEWQSGEQSEEMRRRWSCIQLRVSANVESNQLMYASSLAHTPHPFLDNLMSASHVSSEEAMVGCMPEPLRLSAVVHNVIAKS
jgi:hypothetical protein